MESLRNMPLLSFFFFFLSFVFNLPGRNNLLYPVGACACLAFALYYTLLANTKNIVIGSWHESTLLVHDALLYAACQ